MKTNVSVLKFDEWARSYNLHIAIEQTYVILVANLFRHSLFHSKALFQATSSPPPKKNRVRVLLVAFAPGRREP